MKKLKIYCLLLLLIFITTSSVYAKPTITSDRKTFDIASGQYLLEGNVSVSTNSRVIKAGKARVNVISLEVWGTDGVEVTQNDLSFYGDQVYVNGKSSLAQIDGGVKLETNYTTITANQVDYNWKTKIATFHGNVTFTEGDTTSYFSVLQYNVETNTII